MCQFSAISLLGHPSRRTPRPQRPHRTSTARAIVAFVVPALGLPQIAALSPGVFAQSSAVTESGNQEVQRQQERGRQLREQQQRQPDLRLPNGGLADIPGEQKSEPANTRLPIEESPCFVIKRLSLEGELSQRFQWALTAAEHDNQQKPDAATGRCLGARGIALVVQRIQHAIIAAGYITTRVLAPTQDLNSGLLRLEVIPGRIAVRRFIEGSSPRANSWNALPTDEDELLNLRDIEQGLENLKRLPSVDADIQIVPSGKSGVGYSDIELGWKQPRAVRLNVASDDSGTKATGRYQRNITLALDHGLTLNDLFYLNVNDDMGGGEAGARGSHGYSGHYSIPLGYWLLGFNSSRSRYFQTVAGSTLTYVYSGESSNSDIKLSRVVYRDAAQKLTLSLKGWLRESRNYIEDTEIPIQRRRMAGWEFSANHRRNFAAASLESTLNYREGTGAFAAIPAPEEGTGLGTARPRLLHAETQYNLPFKMAEQSLQYNVSFRTQIAGTPLIAQDRFAIGGRFSVRGYNGEQILLAERGWLVRNDLSLFLGQSSQRIYVGLDHGSVSGRSSDDLVGRHLTGAVIGVRGVMSTASCDFFIGAPVSKPVDFIAPRRVAGFSLNWSL
jgi:hemolysin activation/secretion protein